MTIVLSTYILFMLLFLSGCKPKTSEIVVPTKLSQNFVIQSKLNKNPRQTSLLLNFIQTKMLTSRGIYTNYRNVKSVNGITNGHQMLSESSGLWLIYLASTHQFKRFRVFYKATKKTFNQQIQFSYRYDPQTHQLSNVNATLDDLRIIRALQLYATLTHSHYYRHEAAKRFSLLKTGSLKNGKLANFYDVKTHKQSTNSSLAYYDFVTLKYFETVTTKGKKFYKHQLHVVKQGYLGDAFPLYASSFNLKTYAYSNRSLNTSEALETVLHLAEVGEVKTETLNWLKIQIESGHLYNRYSTLGIVLDKSQSAANYSLAAMIFANAGDNREYQRAMRLAWQAQVTQKGSPLYGGLGDLKSKDAYSYNNFTGN